MDRILINGSFITQNPDMPRAEAVLIRGEKIEWVGTEEECKFKSSASFEITDLKGSMIIPALIDAHTHIGLAALMGDEDDMPVYECQSKAEILDCLREYVKAHPFKLYYGMYFGQIEALHGEALTRYDIDAIVKYRPAVLLETECHSAWLNSSMMKILGIKEDAPDPAPGYSFYERNEKGRMTGELKEMTILPLLKISGSGSDRVIKKRMLRIMDYLLERGVSTVYDAGSYIGEERIYKILSKMDRKGELPLHIEGTHILMFPEQLDNAVEEFKRIKASYESENIKFKTMKMMLDGTHRIHTAKLLDPYCDKNTTGGTLISEERLYEFIKELNDEGIDFHVHTVGEGASHMVLNCVERIINETGKLNIKVTTAHLETMRESDIMRYKNLGVIANYTPAWHGGNDCASPENMIRLLGKERSENQMRAKTMLNSGAEFTFSSDEVALAFMDRWNPFLGIEIGHTRQEINDGGKVAAIFPPESERLDIEDLLKGYTINAAKALRLESQKGSIEAGKDADLVILSDDLFNMDKYEIHNVMPRAVMIRGEVVKGEL